jgi:hypothetical protein
MRVRNLMIAGVAAAQLAIGGSVATVALSSAGSPAFASDNYNPPPQIPQHAQCGTGAASGSFGAFGKNNNFAGGANGPVTGDSNSDVCGNAQGNP